MGRQYSAKIFLRNVPNALLRTYFQDRELDLGFDWLVLGETQVEWIFLGMERLPEEVRSRIDGDFRMINDLACEHGTLAILDQAGGLRSGLAQRFEGMRNAYERAFWTFMNEPDCFRMAGCFHEMDRHGGWRRRFVGSRLEARHDRESLCAFAKQLQRVYRRQGRGRFCHVDYYLRQDPERHCYFAYPEDYASTDIGYDEHGQFQQRARRSALEIIFVYRPDDGTLELRCKGHGRQIAELQAIFGEIVLGLDELPDDRERAPYDLEVLKDEAFPFSTDPQDRIAAVHVRQLRLSLPGPLKRQITVSADSSRQAPEALHDLLREAINRAYVPLERMRVAQAKLRFTFAPVDGERPRTLTFEVGCPDRCTLKDDPQDQVAKKYLRKWGIACA